MYRMRKMAWVLRALMFKLGMGSLGFPSYLGPTTLVVGARRMYIGKRFRALPGLFVEVRPGGRLMIGDNVALGQNVHISTGGTLTIGEGTAITGLSTITDIDHVFDDPSQSVQAQGLRVSRTTIGRNCFVGMGARILPGTSLGDGCIVGANAVVRGTFEPHSVIVGAPARAVKRFDTVRQDWVAVNGEQDGVTEDQCEERP